MRAFRFSLRAGVVGHLRVDLVVRRVVPVDHEIVVRVSGLRRQHQLRQHRRRDRIDAVRRNEVARRKARVGRRRDAAVRKRERHAADAGRRIARQRVVDGRAGLREIAAAQIGGRQRHEAARARLSLGVAVERALPRRLVAEEEEQLVLDDRAAQRAAEHVARSTCPCRDRPAGSSCARATARRWRTRTPSRGNCSCRSSPARSPPPRPPSPGRRRSCSSRR